MGADPKPATARAYLYQTRMTFVKAASEIKINLPAQENTVQGLYFFPRTMDRADAVKEVEKAARNAGRKCLAGETCL